MLTNEQTRRIKELTDRAEEIRARAETMTDKECRETLIRLAASYEFMASGLEKSFLPGSGRWDTGSAN
jgi:hypothetical protein